MAQPCSREAGCSPGSLPRRKQWHEKSIRWMMGTSGARNTKQQLALFPPFLGQKLQFLWSFTEVKVASQKEENLNSPGVLNGSCTGSAILPPQPMQEVRGGRDRDMLQQPDLLASLSSSFLVLLLVMLLFLSLLRRTAPFSLFCFFLGWLATVGVWITAVRVRRGLTLMLLFLLFLLSGSDKTWH